MLCFSMLLGTASTSRLFTAMKQNPTGVFLWENFVQWTEEFWVIAKGTDFVNKHFDAIL